MNEVQIHNLTHYGIIAVTVFFVANVVISFFTHIGKIDFNGNDAPPAPLVAVACGLAWPLTLGVLAIVAICYIIGGTFNVTHLLVGFLLKKTGCAAVKSEN